MEARQKMYKGRGKDIKNLKQRKADLENERGDRRQNLYHRPGLDDSDSFSSVMTNRTKDASKKHKRPLAEASNRPPFITAVPVGRLLPNEKFESVFQFKGANTPLPKKQKSTIKKRKSFHRPPFVVSTRRISIISADNMPRMIATSSTKKKKNVVKKANKNLASISQTLSQRLKGDHWIQSSNVQPPSLPADNEITFNIVTKSGVMTSTVQKEVPAAKPSATVTKQEVEEKEAANTTFDFFDGISPLDDHSPVKAEVVLNETFTEEDVAVGTDQKEIEEPVKVKYPDSIVRHKARASKLRRTTAISEDSPIEFEPVSDNRKVKFSFDEPTVEDASAKRSLFEGATPVNKTLEKLKKRNSKRSSRSIDEWSQLPVATPPAKSPPVVSLLTPAEGGDDTPSKRRRTKLSMNVSAKKPKSANYYYTMLDDVTAHLRGMAQIWLDKQEQEGAELPALANEMIDSATGQTNLLITKKFVQFRKLVGLYDCNAGDKKIYSDDLDGFWSVMYMQVEDLYQRFAELQTMADKGWLEQGSAKKPAAKKNTKKKKTRQPVATKSSGLLDFIRKTRLEKKESGSSMEVEDVKEPVIVAPATPSRQSRRLTLNFVTPRRRSDGCSGCTPSSKSAKKRSRRTQVE